MSKKKGKDLSPYTLMIRAEMDSGYWDDFFDCMYYFACLIEEYGVKPWGWKGKKCLLEVMDIYDNYPYWVECSVCKDYFNPSINEKLIDSYLDYYRSIINRNELYKCKDCGGLEYTKKREKN